MFFFVYKIHNQNIFNKTPLFWAIEKENVDIVKLILSNKNIDVNALNILNQYFLNIIYIKCIFMALMKLLIKIY